METPTTTQKETGTMCETMEATVDQLAEDVALVAAPMFEALHSATRQARAVPTGHRHEDDAWSLVGYMRRELAVVKEALVLWATCDRADDDAVEEAESGLLDALDVARTLADDYEMGRLS